MQLNTEVLVYIENHAAKFKISGSVKVRPSYMEQAYARP
jgi:hypothetical protein